MILRLAHESVVVHIQSCCSSKLRSRPVTIDRVPLTRIPRRDEFGRFATPTPAFVSVAVFSPELESDKIVHRTPEQRQDLQRVPDDVADPFIDSLSQGVAAVHRMTTTADFVPRQRRPYRVPYTVKQEAGRPSQERRDRDFSRPSDNLMVNPTACVANEDGGGRIACDYRDRNLM